MLTGDKENVGKAVAESLGLDRYYGGLMPGDKVQKVEELLQEQREGKTLAFVGDGINDAPVLARADMGIAMGGIGSDAAVEAADVVIMTDEPSKIEDAILISRKTMRIVRQNIVFAIGVKVLVLLLVAMGGASMWAAVFADVGVSVLAILNAIRALVYRRGNWLFNALCRAAFVLQDSDIATYLFFIVSTFCGLLNQKLQPHGFL